MNDPVRLREEFIEFVNMRAAWPSKRAIRAYSPNGFVADKTYLAVRSGKPNNPTDVQEVIAALARHPASRNALREFLQSISYQFPDDFAGLDFALLSQRLSTRNAPIILHEDAFLSGLDWILRTFVRSRPLDYCQMCPVTRILECVTAAYVTLGRSVAKDPRLLHAAAIKVAQDVVYLAPEAYAEKIRIWSDKSPWIFINSWQPVPGRVGVTGHITGSSLIVPVKDEIYDEIKAGRREIYSITADDIVVPSRSLLIQIVGEHPPSKDLPAEINPTKSMRHSTLVQSCVLSRRLKPKDNLRVRALSSSGSEENSARLRGAGFTHVGESSGLTEGHPLYEQVITGKSWPLDPAQTAFRMILGHFGQIREAPPDHIRNA